MKGKLLAVFAMLLLLLIEIQGFYYSPQSLSSVPGARRRLIYNRLFAEKPPILTDPNKIQLNGKVLDSLPNTTFKVELDPSKQVILATVSGRMRTNHIKIINGDKVTVELSPHDLTKGRIVYRTK
jgi:translation initiation factor IF-1